jgi:NAD(P)H-nitrite reductase large subunit
MTIACDAVLLSYGFSSTVDLAVQLGARIDWDDLRQSWTPKRSAAYETSKPMVFAAGDCAGVAGAQVAVLEGVVVGMALAERLAGRPVDAGRVRRIRRQLNLLGRFRRTMDELSLIRPGAWTWADEATVVCRCQGTTVAELSDAAARGVTTIRGLKLGTRAGMGLCQGRVCAPIIAGLVGAAGWIGPDPRSEAPRARFPVKPIPVGAIAQWAAENEL